MLNDFAINYQWVKITPNLKHTFDGDLLEYNYAGYCVAVTFDFTMYDSPVKYDYIENVKYMAKQGLNELRAKDINKWYDNMGVK